MNLQLPPHLDSLLEAARGGSPDALGALFQEFRPFLFVLARRAERHRVRSKISDSDLVQDTFTAAYEEFKQFRGRSPEELLAWLECILQRLSFTSVSRFKVAKRDVGRETSLEGPNARQRIRDHKDTRTEPPSELVLREEDGRIAKEATLRLSEKYRQVIELRYWQEATFEDIARQLNISEEAARKRWKRGLLLWRDQVALLRHEPPPP